MRRNTKTVLLFITLFFLAALLIIIFKQNIKIENYEQQMQNEYTRSLYDLTASLNNISLILEKTLYLNDAKLVNESAVHLFTEAEISKNALSRLPLKGESPVLLGKFLSQVGNYTLDIAQNVIAGKNITNEQRNNLSLLHSASETISKAVNETQSIIGDPEYWSEELESKLEDNDKTSVINSISSLEEELTDLPTLIYDGPFSEHLMKRESKMLKVAEQINNLQAEKIARSVLPHAGSLKYTNIATGTVPVHKFYNDNSTVAITQAGGYLLYLRTERIVEKDNLNYSQAIEKAKLFLSQIGFDETKESYYYTENGICVIDFTGVSGDVICYNELIKVGVALDNGEIILYEGAGYIFNHTEREETLPEYSLVEASEKISENLQFNEPRLVIIPSDGGNEILCYEFHCVAKDDTELLIYINANDLSEQEILIMLKSDGGILVK